MNLLELHKEKITNDIYTIQYYIELRERHIFSENFNIWKKEVWKYIYKNSNNLCKYRQRNLRLTLYRNDPEEKLTAAILRYNSPITEITIWSKNIEVQKKVMSNFKHWESIKNYYQYLLRRIKEYDEKQILPQEKTKQQDKTMSKNKSRKKNPDNPAARIRKARRHLEKLGYVLHKSKNKIATNEDLGLFQIREQATNKIVAGKCYNATLNDIEHFYKEIENKKHF